MATITLDIGNNGTRITNAFAIAFGYQDQIVGPDGDTMIANPVSKAVFTKQKIIDFVRNTVISVEAQQAADAARATSAKSITDNVVIS